MSLIILLSPKNCKKSWRFVFSNTPVWRTISITTIAMLIVILFIDGMAHARIADYKKQLVSVEQQE